jgi:hypothetical protein
VDLNSMIEQKVNHYAQKIIESGSKGDEQALGEITFYVALRRVMSGKATMEDVGLMDAINDTLQQLGLVESGKTFYK